MKTIQIWLIAIMLLLTSTIVSAQTRVVKPTVKTPTSFAIIVDKQSYDRVQTEIEAYRDVVEQDGLATYIVIVEGETPQQIRDLIIEMTDGVKSPLEGVVFVGDIPIPMLRDVQFLSSAFKMDQERPWKQSSIPSDRYYDDFDLKFDLLKQDEENPLFYYFSMAAGSSVTLQSDIYSARIKPTVREGVDKYVALASYLKKVVREHKNLSINTLDNFFIFRGHGYNSNALDAWSGEQYALREQIPSLFENGSRVRFYDYTMLNPIKYALFRQIQSPDLDIALFHHHGSPKNQYINNTITVASVGGHIDRLKYMLRNAMRDSKDKDKILKRYKDDFGIDNKDWFDLTDSIAKADSIFNASLDIYLEDIYAISPAARFVMFDACFNGSFNNDDYVAGAYLFNDGSTVVTQASSVNSVQDKWPNEFIGLLSYGMRIGQWGRHVNYLETHILGDPTFRFRNSRADEYEEDINRAIVLHKNDVEYWKKVLHSFKPELMTISLKMLHEANYHDMDPLLERIYGWSPYGIVRMECLKLLSIRRSPEFKTILKCAVFDNYEMVRRKAADFLGECGDDDLIPTFVTAYIEEELSRREFFYLSDGILFFDKDMLIAEFNTQLSEHPSYNNEDRLALLSKITKSIDRSKEQLEADMDIVRNQEETIKKRIREIKTFKNYHYHHLVGDLVPLAEDPANPDEVRIAIIEALGWFHYSFKRDMILNMCDNILQSNAALSIKEEAAKTKARLL